MNFTFVAHKGARPEKSELVKSHVMREAQKKRKEARRPRNLQSSHTAARPLVATSSHVATEEAMQHFQPKLPTSYPHSANVVVQVEDSHALLTQGSRLDKPQSTWLGALTSPFDSVLTSSLPQWEAHTYPGSQETEFDQPTFIDTCRKVPEDSNLFHMSEVDFSAFLDSKSNVNFVANGVYSFSQETSPMLLQEPLQYPSFVGDQIPLDTAWMSPSLFHLLNERASLFTETMTMEQLGQLPTNPATYWDTTKRENTKILSRCALFYRAYQEAVQGDTREGHQCSKDRTLSLIKSAFKGSPASTDDVNITSAIAMSMYELIRGSEHIVTHLKALRQMLVMRGGINNLPNDQGQQLSELALIQDMVYAVCSNSPPFMFDLSEPLLRDVRTASFEVYYEQSPLRTLNDGNLSSLPEALASSSEILKDAFEGFEMFCIETFDDATARDESQLFKLRKDESWARLADSMTAVEKTRTTGLHGAIGAAVQLAARIHHRATTFRTQHYDIANTADMENLHAILQEMSMNTWKVAHFVYLWVLLTGAAASHGDTTRQPYFRNEVLRLGMSIGLCDWDSFRQCMVNFLWFQQCIRQNRSGILD